MTLPNHKRFHHLLDNVSVKILDGGLSDHEIADECGTSKEFVRRQRKFLKKPLTPRPQQRKRGLFSAMEVSPKNMNQRQSKHDVKAKLTAWVEANPTGYMEKGYNQIAKETDVSPASVSRTLPKIIAEREGISVEEVKAKRRSAGFFIGCPGRNKETQPTESEAEAKDDQRPPPRQSDKTNGSPTEEEKHLIYQSQGVLDKEGSPTPRRDERKVISGHFDKSLYQQLAHLAIDRDCSIQALMVEALHLLFEKEGRSNQ